MKDHFNGGRPPAPVLVAAASQALAREDFEAVEALGARFGPDAEPGVEAAFRYALANARMRLAFEEIAANDIDEATVVVRLAQDDYRAALRLTPADYEVKFNLDLASRLVRNFARPAIEPEEEGERPRDVWTDLPGLPRGLP